MLNIGLIHVLDVSHHQTKIWARASSESVVRAEPAFFATPLFLQRVQDLPDRDTSGLSHQARSATS